jgi:hypothetical protein
VIYLCSSLGDLLLRTQDFSSIIVYSEIDSLLRLETIQMSRPIIEKLTSREADRLSS